MQMKPATRWFKNIRQNQQQEERKMVRDEQMGYAAKSFPWHLVSFTHASKKQGHKLYLTHDTDKNTNTSHRGYNAQ